MLLDLAGLLLAWEDKRRQSMTAAEAAAKAAAEADEGPPSGGWRARTSWLQGFTAYFCHRTFVLLCIMM
jgi:hypothetical protein